MHRAAMLKDTGQPVSPEDIEFLDEYLNAARRLMQAGLADAKSRKGYERVVDEPSVAMPLLFLCRHTMELALKQVLLAGMKDPSTEHSIAKLYDRSYSTIVAKAGEKTAKNQRKFAVFIDGLDPSGTKFRYAEDKEKGKNKGLILRKPTKTTWLDPSELYNDTKLFIDTLRKNNLIPCSVLSSITTKPVPGGTAYVSKPKD